MASPRKTPASTGRKSAYVARNRAAILKAAQHGLADIGPEVTVDQIAELAQMSVSTLYMHFQDKEELFATAIQGAFTDWESWKDEQLVGISDPLLRLIIPMRLYVRVASTHPLYANLIIRNHEMISRLLPKFSVEISKEVKSLVTSGKIVIDKPETRVLNLTAVLFAQLQQQLLNPTRKIAEADEAIAIALTMLGITENAAKKIMDAKLPI